MKKRNHSPRKKLNSNGGNWLGAIGRRVKRARRSWTFERLEDRYYFTATPLTGLEGLQWASVSNSTAEGQQLVDALEQLWALQASSNNPTGSIDATVRSVPTDPYFQYQWHLFNVGQSVTAGQIQDLFGVPGEDINVIPAWDLGYTGAGVNVAVVDGGVQLDHPDLIGRLAFGYDALRDRPGGGPQGDDAHGTAVAGLIGANANNGIGGVGVAFGSTIVPIRFLGAGQTEDTFINAIEANGVPIDIYNHSWGPIDVMEVDGVTVGNRGVDALTMNELIALTLSARNGRNGLGAIHVFAAGNGAEAWDSAGSDGYVNSRYTIAVGIVDHDGFYLNSDGTSTVYGEMAPSVLIVAPSASGPTDIINDFATGSGIFTTDLTTGGINVPPLPSGIDLDIDTFPDDDFTSRFGGTSAAAPLVSGVIALMLEANPNLTYRDVEEILVRSARQSDDLDASWAVNNTSIFRDPVAPIGQDPLNDGIEWAIVPGEVTTPGVEATTGPINATNATFSIHALPDGAFSGATGNDITVTFSQTLGIAGANATFDGMNIHITVIGNATTWGQIAQAVNQDQDLAGDFQMIVGAGAQGVFAAADVALTATLTGGVAEEGEEPTAESVDPNYHPIFDPRTQPIPATLFTNGAGFTVSHGRQRGSATEYGYAHGVVDAALAVQLALQWHLKDQNLPSEKTWVNGAQGSIRIRAAQVTNEDSGEFLIPGGLSNATDGYIEYFNEFFKVPTVTAGDPEAMPPTEDMIDPDSLPFGGEDPPINFRGTHVEVVVPAIDVVTGGSNLMSTEWVEVKLNITGESDAMNYLRITLVSPDGTHSELTQNHFRGEDIDKNFQFGTLPVNLFVGFGDSITAVDDMGMNGNELDWVYSTNRNWGERSDSKPIVNEDGIIIGQQNWELHFENYSGSDLQLNGVTIAFHGTPVGSPAGPVERVQGKVGVDAGRYIVLSNEIVGALDGEFNFDRSIDVVPSLLYPGGKAPDPNQESFAGNVTVYAIDNSTGQRVAEFLTGADGNYYFDLPAGEYTFGVEDPLGRTALDSNGTNYDNEWVVEINTSDGLTRTAGMTHTETIDIDGVMFEVEVVDLQYNNVNFLLDPGSLPPDEVIFTGDVIADLDGDGTQDAQDTGVFNFTVFADLNHTGQFEIGEPFALTEEDGTYELTVPTASANTFTIGVKAPTGWTPTSPSGGFLSEYALPGETVPGFRFLFEPPSTPSGEGNGYLFGSIFNDKNGDGIKQQNEGGLADVIVFIDADLDGEFDQGEISTTTTSTGAYQFGEVIVGTVRIDAVVQEPFKLTSPIQDVLTGEGWIDITLLPGQVSHGNDFGIQNLAVADFGDLFGANFQSYGATPAQHFVVQGFSLGATIDAEIRPKVLTRDPASPDEMPTYIPDVTKDGIGDDQDETSASFDDEDGVVLVGGVLRPGANTLSVTVNGVGGYLQGWIDFNDDGMFGAGEQVFTNRDLNQGSYQLLVTAPQSLPAGQVAARFRWGTINKNYFGSDIIGEVEDYLFDSEAAPIVLPPGDFNGDQLVNNDDYSLWKSTFGSTTDLRADGNLNGVIDTGDYTVWRNNEGAGPGTGGGGGALASQPAVEDQAAPQASEPLASLAPQLPVQIHQLGGQAAAPSVSSEVTALGTYSAPSTVSTAGAGSLSVDLLEVTEVNLSLAGVQFSTTVSSGDSASVVSGTTGPAAADVDALLLLLVHGPDQDSTSVNGLSGGGGLEWGKGEGGQDDEFDLAVATAFGDETDWWLTL